ncbi:endopeptidase La [candidate division TA06 bacterium]|nr:endopeptidase La [candidate division TA06 bacterium]
MRVGMKLPLLPLRDLVVFPFMVVPLLVGRRKSVKATEGAMKGDKMIFVLTQRDPEVSEPKQEDLYDVGTLAKVIQILRLPDGTARILVEGLIRARVSRFHEAGEFPSVEIALLQRSVTMTKEANILLRSVKDHFKEFIRLSTKIPDDVLHSILSVTNPERFSDTVSAHLSLKIEENQRLLDTKSLSEHLQLLNRYIAQEIEILKLEKKIEKEVKTQVTKSQRHFYLQEQLKAIKKELGYGEEETEEAEELTLAIQKAKMPKKVEEVSLKELKRLMRMPPLSPEATVVRNYLDWLIAMPWQKRTKDNMDIEHAEKILDQDHYGLKNVKERLVEYLSVLKLVKRMRGQILCFVGPPGVGKTSLGKSIARAMGRKFIRASLGGVRDEAEIRGHRRTYIGALPGRIIQKIKESKTKNPVFLLDEVDKIGLDFRGDPASALLEVLDPEVNSSFNDHYLEVDFDLSEVLFICTANVTHTIPPALLDRMEILRLPGYLEYEKVWIAKGFLIPKTIKSHGLSSDQILFTEGGLQNIIQKYTQEAGVRNLEREIATLCRKAARGVVKGFSKNPKGKKKKVVVTKQSLDRYLGPPKFFEQEIEKEQEVGVATGLAWTNAGGEILAIEVGIMPGQGKLILTGHLGEVMKESAQAALTFARARAKLFGLEQNFHEKLDIHLHIPAASIPKDGPSAGIAIATAIISALTQTPILRNVAMTGEITLRGIVLPVGGLQEKFVAAQRAGVKTIILPKKNERDLKELPARTKKGITVKLVTNVDEVLTTALLKDPRTTSPAILQREETVYAH